MDVAEELYVRSRVYEHDARLNQITHDLNNIKGVTSKSVVTISSEFIDDRIIQEVNKKMERLIDKVVSVYDLYCGDRSLSVDEFENKVRKLLLE